MYESRENNRGNQKYFELKDSENPALKLGFATTPVLRGKFIVLYYKREKLKINNLNIHYKNHKI